MMLNIQNIAGETTRFAFSDIIHWINILAEKQSWAKAPINKAAFSKAEEGSKSAK